LNAIDVTVHGDFTFTAVGQTGGLVTRYGGPKFANLYWGYVKQVDATHIQAFIFRNLNGLSVQIGSSPNDLTTRGASVSLDFQAEGTSLKLFVNSTMAAYASDNNLHGGSVGMTLLGANATVANFVADAVTSTAQTIPFHDDFSAATTDNQLDTNTWI